MSWPRILVDPAARRIQPTDDVRGARAVIHAAACGFGAAVLIVLVLWCLWS